MRVFLRALSVSVLVCLATLSTFGQGSQRKDRVQAVDGRAMGGQQIQTCAYNSASYTLGLYTGAVPCSPSITTYADVALSVPNNIPLLTDSQGNFTYWLTSGNYTECIIGPNVTSLCYAITLGGTGGGGGGSPASPPIAVQLSNPTVSGFQTVAGPLTGGVFGIDSGTLPTKFTVPFNECIAGPRPHFDVTCWGAAGDGVTNDFSAIQNTLTAACANKPAANATASIYFPPGVYRYSQPQVGSGATSVFTQTCPLRLEGAGQTSNSGAQFPSSPAVSIIPLLGANPLDVPVFLWGTANTNSSSDGIVLEGYKQGYQINAGTNFKFTNGVASTISASPTLSNGDCPVTLSNTLFDSFLNFTTQVQSTAAYGYCFIDTAPLQPVGVITIDGGGHASSGCLVYYQPNVPITNSVGTWVINNAPIENCSGPGVVQIANPGALSTEGITDLHFMNDLGSDTTNSAQAFLYTALPVAGVTIEHVFAGANSLGSSIVVAPGGSVQDYREICGSSQCTSTVQDTSGNLVGNGTWNSIDGGTYHVSAVNSPQPQTGKCRSDFNTGKSQWNTPNDSWFNAGGGYADIAVDANCGIMQGLGTGYGFSSTWQIPTQGQLGLYFMKTYPPTSLTATAGSAGGTLPAGTYTYDVRSTTSSACATNASAPSLTTSPVTIGASTQINLTWVVPVAGTGTITGYCVQRNPGPFVNTAFYVSGSGSTTFTDSGASPTASGVMPYVNALAATNSYAFTPTLFSTAGNVRIGGLAGAGVAITCVDNSGNLLNSGCGAGTGTVTNPSGNFTLGYPATSANATTGIAASPIYIDAAQFTGADFSAQIQNALAGCVSANAGCAVHAEATVTAGGSATGTVNPLANVTTTGSANIDLYLPCAQMLTNVQWYSPSSDVRVHGCGLHSGTSVIQASASFPASTPIIRIGDGTHAPFRSYYDGVRIACGSAPTTCTGFLGNLLQERAGLYQDAIYGANSSTATGPLIKCLGCTHEAFIDLELLQYGANDGLLLDGNNVIQLAQGKVDNITCNNTGFNQGATCVHIQDTGASGATYYNTKVSLIHGENIATVVSFDSQSDGEVDTADCSANCSTVLVRNTTGYVHQVNIGTQATGVAQYVDSISGVSISNANFQRVASGTAGSGANLMSGTIWPVIAKSAGYTLGYGDEQVTFTGTIAITVPVAPPTTGTAKRWLVINDGVGTGTLACSSGNINGSATLALTANQSVTVTADGVNCFSTSGSGSVGTSTQYANTYWATTSTLGGVAAPNTNGTYVCGYSITGSAAVAPTCPQLGFGGRSITSTTSTDPVLYSDVASVINHDVGASNASTETLPTATTLLNPAFSFVYTNHSAFLDTITATTWTIQLNGATATSSISVPSGASVRIKVDPNSATLWDADCALCQVNAFTTLTDAATVSWNIGKQPNANASLTFTVHSGSRTLNVSNMVVGGNYLSKIIQDATGGEGLTLGTGCTWKIINGGGGAVTPSTGANAIDVLAWIFDGTNCIGSLGKNYN